MINSSTAEFYIVVCHNVEVHITGNTMGYVISDTVLCFLNLFTAAISIASNGLVIRVYAKATSVKTTGNFLLVCLSTLELIKSMFVQPAFVVWKVLEISKLNFCHFYLFTILAQNFFSLSSFLQTCFLITIERYLSVFQPIFHRKAIVFEGFKVAVIVTEITVALFLLSTFFTAYHRLYFTVTYLLIFLCLTSTAIMYIKIRAKMKQTPAGSSQATDLRIASKQAADRRMNHTVISIIVISIACYLPLFGMFVFVSFHERTVWHTRYVIPWMYLLAFCTAAINPFVYCWKNRKLRNEMMKITTKVFRTRSVKRNLESSMVSNQQMSQTTTA